MLYFASMLRALILSIGVAATAACGRSGVVAESPAAPVSAAVWVTPDLAFALPLPEGWVIESSDAVVAQPMYRAEIEAVASEHASGIKPSCRLGVVDFRLVDEFLLKDDPKLSSGEVDELVRTVIEAVEEDVWPLEAYRQMASDGPYECDCEEIKTTSAFESFSAVYVSDAEAKSSWHVRFETPGEHSGYLFFASQRAINANMFTQINCVYPSYAERARRSADDIGALRAAMDRLNSERPAPERDAFR